MSTLAKAILVDLDFAGEQLGVPKDSWAGLSGRIKTEGSVQNGLQVGKGQRQGGRLGGYQSIYS